MALGQFPDISPLTYIFGVDILFLAGFSLIIIAFIEKLAKKQLLFWLIALLLFGSLNEYLPVYIGNIGFFRYLQAFFWGYFHWSYFPVFPWLTYPLAGYIFRLIEEKRYFEKIDKKWEILLFIALSLIVTAGFGFAFKISSILELYYHHTALFASWTLAFMGWWVLLWRFMLQFSSKKKIVIYLQFLGKNVTVFYVLQWLLIGNLATLLYKTQGIQLLVVWFVLIMLSTSMLTKFYLRVRKKQQSN